MQLVSTKTADKNEVIKLSKDLENQMKVRQEREMEFIIIVKNLYSECFDELIRQVTINSL